MNHPNTMMMSLPRSTVLLLVPLLAGCVAAGALNDPQADIEAIEAQSRRLSDAYVRGDIEELVSIYAPDGVAAPAGVDFIRGHDDLLDLWELPEGRTVLEHSATPIEIEVDGDHAYDWGYYQGQAAQDGKALDPFRGMYVIVWERGEDGVWRIAMDMWGGVRDED